MRAAFTNIGSGYSFFPRGGDGLGVAREVPGHEDFLARGPRAEDVGPGAAPLAAGAEPDRPQLRSDLVLVSREVFHELARNARREGAVGFGGMVARRGDHPDLVLDLDHHHGA
jgi:hypothetical protein